MEKPIISLTDHEELGENLKRHLRFLEITHRLIAETKADARHTSIRSQLKKDLNSAKKAVRGIQNGMHLLLMDDFSMLPDEELLPVYLGRLERLTHQRTEPELTNEVGDNDEQQIR
jgi:hypothetical protein